MTFRIVRVVIAVALLFVGAVTTVQGFSAKSRLWNLPVVTAADHYLQQQPKAKLPASSLLTRASSRVRNTPNNDRRQLEKPIVARNKNNPWLGAFLLASSIAFGISQPPPAMAATPQSYGIHMASSTTITFDTTTPHLWLASEPGDSMPLTTTGTNDESIQTSQESSSTTTISENEMARHAEDSTHSDSVSSTAVGGQDAVSAFDVNEFTESLTKSAAPGEEKALAESPPSNQQVVKSPTETSAVATLSADPTITKEEASSATTTESSSTPEEYGSSSISSPVLVEKSGNEITAPVEETTTAPSETKVLANGDKEVAEESTSSSNGDGSTLTSSTQTGGIQQEPAVTKKDEAVLVTQTGTTSAKQADSTTPKNKKDFKVSKDERKLEEEEFQHHELSDAQIAWLRKH